MSSAPINKKSLKRLVPALEAVKEKDAAALRVHMARINAIEAEIEALKASVAEAATAGGDFETQSAFFRYRDVSMARVETLEAEREAAEIERAKARETLARSYGKLEGVNRLIARKDPIRRGV